MNERIRELADQAILQCVDENGFLGKDKSIRINPDNYVDQAMVQEFIEKFAELIVRECAAWIVSNAASIEHLGPEYFSKAMIKDFGVE